MNTYEIADYSGNGSISLMNDGPIISAETGRKALDIYLKNIGFKGKVKVSASTHVHFKVEPVYVDESGKKWIDHRQGKRGLWYQIQN